MHKIKLDENDMIRELERAGYVVGLHRLGSCWRCTLHRGNLRSTHEGTTATVALHWAMVAVGLAK